ncbi:DNA-directed RNA polymerase subunit omega [Allobacillus sp. GCM10007491]|uniref:DNA-directed RNA polymerase subunit omega n=2 Tax=Allobacillus TaxID=1400133 RepID=A0A941CS20_9BACI|nr:MULTISPECIES: DNA-directed RNA polymerase subunit omega [Allobacillus]MBR7552823.1 DNA-directed RNA polymerase subunit omega [Allobacillus saliphilus]TSJ67089.1 DNA-directed RNA polymerase subunit omega [Allobacillus salarius]
MLEPSVDNLLKKIDSKYAIVTIAAQRARELHQKENYMVENPTSKKWVGIALEEILDEKLTVKQ